MLYTKELNIAIQAAKDAGIIQLNNQHRMLRIEMKDDRSPVTDVDRECEELIRHELLSVFPEDGFVGEETGTIKGKNSRKWLVDPLDGTRPYIRGIPTYSVLVALEDNGEYVVGVAHFPAKKETYWAGRDGGAFCNNQSITVSGTKEMSAVMGSSLGLIEKSETLEGKNLLKLMQKWDYAYGFMDAYSYMCVACGKLDMCIGLIDTPLDRASAACIIAEAGGSYSDLQGNRTIQNSSFVLSNGLLDDQIIKHFS